MEQLAFFQLFTHRSCVEQLAAVIGFTIFSASVVPWLNFKQLAAVTGFTFSMVLHLAGQLRQHRLLFQLASRESTVLA